MQLFRVKTSRKALETKFYITMSLEEVLMYTSTFIKQKSMCKLMYSLQIQESNERKGGKK